MYFLIPYNGRPSRSILARREVNVRGVPASAGMCPGRRGCQKYRTGAEFALQRNEEPAQRTSMAEVSPPSFSSPCKSNLSCPCAASPARASSILSPGRRSWETSTLHHPLHIDSEAKELLRFHLLLHLSLEVR